MIQNNPGRIALTRATIALAASLLVVGAAVGYAAGYGQGASRANTVTTTVEAPFTTQQIPSTIIAENQTTTAIGPIKHIIILMMENEEYGDVIGSSDAPYETMLASQYAIAGDYFAVTHPSLPNYLALVAGDTFGFSTDCLPVTCTLPYQVTTVANLLNAKHLSWREYAESMPTNCSQTTSVDGLYDPEHDPFVYFSDVTGNYGTGSTSPYCDSHVVPLDQFWTDSIKDNLPAYSMITPNICDDAHSCQLPAGDTWLSTYVPLIINSPSFSSTALFIVYDEGTTGLGPGGGQVVCLLVSPFAKHGYVSTVEYTHYSLLATVEAIFGLGNLGRNDATASPMSDLFASGFPGA